MSRRSAKAGRTATWRDRHALCSSFDREVIEVEIGVQGDVAKAADVKKIFAETKQAFGRLDILVNNAGVYNFLPLEEVTEEDFHRHFNINVLGLLLATKEAAKLFGDAGGSVINIGSVASDLNPPNTVVYTATKGARSTR